MTEDLQRWERRVPATDVAVEALTVAVGDGDGTARIRESVLAQLLSEAGWERTA